MQQAEGFVRDDFGLKPFRSEIWKGFIFVNLDGAAPPLCDGPGGNGRGPGGVPPGGHELVIAREWDCAFNWKVLVENFMESYHHLGIHHKTLQPMMPARDTWTEQERRHYIRAHLPYKESVREEYRALRSAATFPEICPRFPA